MSKPTYGLVGRGRVARHLAHYLEREGQRCLSWHRGMSSPPESGLAGADVILLAIRDDALAPFLAANPRLAERTVVHFSGSLTIPGAVGLHPLMTFGPEFYELATYRAIPWVEERGGSSFADIFPALDNPSWPLDPELKPLYHAFCVLAGNFTTLLWTRAGDGFEHSLGLPRELLLPYLQQTCRNIAASGGEALTGALARGDRGTAERDLAALAGDPYARVYEAFTAVFDGVEVTA